MQEVTTPTLAKEKAKNDKLTKGFRLMCEARSMSAIYEENFKIASKYVHATSKGHEAIQIAAGMLLTSKDYAYPYYRDDAMLLGMGLEPYELMLQLFAKKDDPFSAGRTYYSHPSLNRPDKPKIPHQSSATGMQAIPATGAALGLKYKKDQELPPHSVSPVVLCSLGDACVTEGEVSEAFQMAALKQLPILYLVQDNEWDISASADEIRSQNAYEFADGFKGLEAISIDGTDFQLCYDTLKKAIETIRKEQRPILVHASVPLLNHHTSGVRMEWYRDDLEAHQARDPFPVFRKMLKGLGISEKELESIEEKAELQVKNDFERAYLAEDPSASDLFTHDFAPTPVTEESGERKPAGAEKTVMVDCALHAVEELMANKECLLYGQDVGIRLGGVFREAATLAEKFGDSRVFNTPIQEAFIIGSTAGMSAVGLKPIVEVQFADYIWPGLNQLFTEVSRSCYLSNGKWPVSMILRVPIGAYGSGGPYHSSSVESVLSNIKGIKVVYPSNGADLKGLMKAAYHDPNPVVMLEHKGLYWSKVPGTLRAKTFEPSEDYILPLGQASLALEIEEKQTNERSTTTVVTYGMGVHWALNAAESFDGQIEIVDLRTISPVDYDTIYKSVKKTNRCLVVTEEPKSNSFALGLAGRIQENCFRHLEAPVMTIGSEDLPAIPLNSELEKAILPSSEKVKTKMEELLAY